MMPPVRGTFLLSRREPRHSRPHSVEISHAGDPACRGPLVFGSSVFSLHSVSPGRETGLHFFPGSAPRRERLVSRRPSPWLLAEPPACIATSGYSKGSFVFVRRI